MLSDDTMDEMRYLWKIVEVLACRVVLLPILLLWSDPLLTLFFLSHSFLDTCSITLSQCLPCTINNSIAYLSSSDHARLATFLESGTAGCGIRGLLSERQYNYQALPYF